MTIITTVTARCDRQNVDIIVVGRLTKGRCDQRFSINPRSTQPFLELADAGWGLDTADGEVLTFCPAHKVAGS